MKSKLAIWSFILAFVIIVLVFLSFAAVFSYSEVFLIFLYVLEIVSFGLGVFALVVINNRKDLEGKWFAIIAIAINSVVLLYEIIYPLTGFAY